MSNNKLKNRQISEEAACWVIKFDADGITKSEKKDFASWLSQSSLHVDEFLLSASILTGLSRVDIESKIDIDNLLEENNHPEVVPLFDESAKVKKEPENTSYIRKYLPSIAASFLLFCVTSVYVYNQFSSSNERIAFTTKTGEQRSLTLTDGSIVHVNTETSISIRYLEAERIIHLTQGEAMFDVAHDKARPFRVYTDTSITQAVGTIFNVRNIKGLTKVAVLEGSVSVDTDGKEMKKQRLMVKAGELASLTLDGELGFQVNPTIEDVGSWRYRRLVFKSNTLEFIASEFNRYNQEKIYIDDVDISDIKFSGVFDADDPQSFIKYLESLNTIRVDKTNKNEFHLRSPSRTDINNKKL